MELVEHVGQVELVELVGLVELVELVGLVVMIVDMGMVVMVELVSYAYVFLLCLLLQKKSDPDQDTVSWV